MFSEKHRLYLARPSLPVARRSGLNRNHHVRLWCECQSQQRSEPGALPSGPYWTDRPAVEVAGDPRRLGGWDHFAVADTRVPHHAVTLFQQHVEDEEAMTYEQAMSAGRVFRAATARR